MTKFFLKLKRKSSIWRRYNIYLLVSFIIVAIVLAYVALVVGPSYAEEQLEVSISKHVISYVISTLENKEDISFFQEKLKAIDQYISAKREKLKYRQAKLHKQKLNRLRRKALIPGLNKIVKNDIFNIYLRATLVVLVAFITLMLISYIFIKEVIDPLESIIQTSKKVARGDLSVTFEVKTKDELGQLAEILNEMLANFQELHTNLENSAISISQVVELIKEADSNSLPKLISKLERTSKRMMRIINTFKHFAVDVPD